MIQAFLKRFTGQPWARAEKEGKKKGGKTSKAVGHKVAEKERRRRGK